MVSSRRDFRTMAVLSTALMVLSCAKPKTFEENYETAKENAVTKSGRDYDAAVGGAMQESPKFMLSQRDCVIKNPGEASLHGYLLIKSATEYSVVLEPKGALADCIQATMVSRTLPTPPTTPYLNPYEFAVSQ